MEDNDWVAPGVLPDWSEIHHNVLTQARMDAARMQETAERNAIFGDDERTAAQPITKTEFMRKAGFDERYILMLVSWVEEQQQIVNSLANVYQNELQTSLEALIEAQVENHTTESESE